MTESDDDLLDVEAVDELDLDEVDSVEALDTDALPDAGEVDLTQLGPLVGLAKSVLESVTEGDDDPSAGEKQARVNHLKEIHEGEKRA